MFIIIYIIIVFWGCLFVCLGWALLGFFYGCDVYTLCGVLFRLFVRHLMPNWQKWKLPPKKRFCVMKQTFTEVQYVPHETHFRHLVKFTYYLQDRLIKKNNSFSFKKYFLPCIEKNYHLSTMISIKGAQIFIKFDISTFIYS